MVLRDNGVMLGINGAEISRFRRRAALLAALFCAELFALAVLYQFFATIECQATDALWLCRFLRSLVARALVVFAVFAVLVWARPAPFAVFLRESDRHRSPAWAVAHVAGVILLLLPLIMAAGRDLGPLFGFAVWPWSIGAALAALGGVFWVAPARGWRALIAEDRYAAVVVLVVAALLPDIADWALPIWDVQAITGLTFRAVSLFLGLFNSEVYTNPAGLVIGVREFAVHIARQCSGIEGVALVTGFVCLYAFIFRTQVRFPHYWVVVLPSAIMVSWLLNVVRIGALVLIGAHVSPQLAVNGFHSYAGWLLFTLLALAIVWAVQSARWLHADGATGQGPRLLDDPMAAMILPFVAFMMASMLSQAMFPQAELGYPLRALAVMLALWVFRAAFRHLTWRLDPFALGAGVVVGVGWLVLNQSPPEEGAGLAAALGRLSGFWLSIWIVFRLIGTVLLVPFVEEMFFRGYLLGRLDQGDWRSRAVAIAVSTGLFAALHGRWLAAGLAGAVFAFVMLRNRRVEDCVLAHVVANLIIAVWALVQSDFSLI